LLDELMEPTEPRVRVGVDDLLKGSIAILEGQHLTGALLTPAVPVREHELAGRLAESRSPVPRSHPRELLCYHGAGDVVEPLIYVDVLRFKDIPLTIRETGRSTTGNVDIMPGGLNLYGVPHMRGPRKVLSVKFK
jgi:hypothetical protein